MNSQTFAIPSIRFSQVYVLLRVVGYNERSLLCEGKLPIFIVIFRGNTGEFVPERGIAYEGGCAKTGPQTESSYGTKMASKFVLEIAEMAWKAKDWLVCKRNVMSTKHLSPAANRLGFSVSSTLTHSQERVDPIHAKSARFHRLACQQNLKWHHELCALKWLAGKSSP